MKQSRTGRVTAAVAAGVALAAIAACASGTTTTSSSGQSLASGKTLTIGLGADPGSLDPQRSVNGANIMMSVFAYDTPVTLLDSGQVTPEVLTSWKAAGKSYTLTVRSGVTCADGSAMDAKAVADNINYVGNAKNASPMAGVAVPAGATAKADAASSTVAVTLPSPAPFFMQNLAELPLVCEKGLASRGILAKTSSGSGPYVLSAAVPGDHYDYVLRKGYTWGPAGATTAAKGMPAKLRFSVVTSPTTTANLLLNGQLNVAQLSGANTTRLTAARVFSSGSQLIGQELAFNEASGEAAADVAVRRALIGALNLPDLAKVDSGGTGKTANGMIADPKICSGDTMKGNTPAYDPAGAKAALDQAGWAVGAGGIRSKAGAKLSVSLIFANEEPTTAATAEYIATQWKSLGVDVKLDEQSFDQTSAVVFGKGEWGATLIGLGVNNPATLVPFFSGPSPSAGNNFGHYANSQYAALVAKAGTEDGTAGCPDWNAAESALFKDADITPISTKPFLYWGKDAKFDVIAHVLIPTSLRALSD